MNREDLMQYVTSIPDYPKEGIIFRDVTSLLQNAKALQCAVDEMAFEAQQVEFDVIAGVEARGFVFGAALAYRLGRPFVLVRKVGKLPRETVSESYTLEYGEATVEMHKDAINPGQKVIIVDDLLATGGTAGAACKLVKSLGGEVAQVSFLIELDDLGGRKKLEAEGYNVSSILHYEGE